MYKFVTDPETPAFPGASLLVGRWAGWLFDFCSFLGLRPGPFGRVLSWLAQRRMKVEWSRMSFENRLKATLTATFVGFAMIVPLRSR